MSDLRTEFKNWQTQSSRNTLAFASRATGISRPVISDWAANKYKGSNDNVESKIKAFLVVQNNKRKAVNLQVQFTDTLVSMKIDEVLDICGTDNDIVVITGDSGLGKTTALNHYLKDSVNDLLIEVDQSYSAFSLVKVLHKKLCAHTGKEAMCDMLEEIIAKLKNSDRKIIIDEAEYLPTKALDILRRINDKAGVGLALVGLPRLEANLRGRRGEHAQLHNRVGVFCKLEKISLEDASYIVKMIAPESSDKSISLLYSRVSSTRALVKLTRRANRIATINNREIDAEIIEAASNHLML